MLRTVESVEAAVRKAVADTVITDIHTHLFPPSHGNLLAWGVDDLLTYHYLVAELFTVAPRELTIEKFWALPKTAQADLVWEHVFIRHGALSEAARGVLTALHLLGLDTAKRDLPALRSWFADQDVNAYLEKVFELAHIDYAVMTNNPFAPEEAVHLERDLPIPPMLKTGLRIESLLTDWPGAVTTMNASGYDVKLRPDEKSFAEVRRFLTDWSKKLKPVYFAASLPPEFTYPESSVATQVIDRAIMPVSEELSLPLALMIGVYRRVNPALGWGGDGMGLSKVSAVQNLAVQHPNGKFLVTMLARANQHELAVLGRKFSNLHLFGCWWFCNVPSIIEEMTRQRIELLGTAFTAQHSDARVADQLLYKWSHSRQVLAKVLVEKYRDLFEAGWRPTEKEIARDVRALLGGSFAEFMAK